MKSEIRKYVRLVLESIESIDGPYTQNLADDESLQQKSALVPDDIKDKIKKYLSSMGLSPQRSKKRR